MNVRKNKIKLANLFVVLILLVLTFGYFLNNFEILKDSEVFFQPVDGVVLEGIDNSNYEDYFEFQRADITPNEGDGIYSTITSINSGDVNYISALSGIGGTFTFTDNLIDLQEGHTYRYQTRACNIFGCSGWIPPLAVEVYVPLSSVGGNVGSGNGGSGNGGSGNGGSGNGGSGNGGNGGGTQCNNDIDDDGDGDCDWDGAIAGVNGCSGNPDIGCSNSQDISEANPNIPISYKECEDGIDNDNDGFIDFPGDSGCENLSDNSEDSDNVNVVNDSDDFADGYGSEISRELIFGSILGILALGIGIVVVLILRNLRIKKTYKGLVQNVK